MSDGLTKEESKTYDAKHPFANRDPRMAMTILYPGRDWRGDVLNTLMRKFLMVLSTRTSRLIQIMLQECFGSGRNTLDLMDQYEMFRVQEASVRSYSVMREVLLGRMRRPRMSRRSF